jgi:hypothetical protein
MMSVGCRAYIGVQCLWVLIYNLIRTHEVSGQDYGMLLTIVVPILLCAAFVCGLHGKSN